MSFTDDDYPPPPLPPSPQAFAAAREEWAQQQLDSDAWLWEVCQCANMAAPLMAAVRASLLTSPAAHANAMQALADALRPYLQDAARDATMEELLPLARAIEDEWDEEEAYRDEVRRTR